MILRDDIDNVQVTTCTN